MNILLVDDESEILEELLGFLRRRGYRVSGVDGVSAALHALGTKGPFDVVVTDMRMADGSGVDVVRACKECRQPQPTAFVMSGHAGPEEMQQVQSEGAKHVLAKPLSLRILHELLSGIASRQ